jgi:hypothetical protein
MSELSQKTSIRTLRCRVKDKYAKVLCALAREVNVVWNYNNELSYKHTQRTGNFLSAYDLESGSFSEDARGRWYCNTTVRVECKPSEGRKSVGIDLGLKTTPTAAAGTNVTTTTTAIVTTVM